MAFGKSTETNLFKDEVIETTLWRNNIIREDKTKDSWKSRWNWILEEYAVLHEKLAEVSKGSEFLSDVNKITKEEDKRSIKPVPETTNHEYGWLSAKPEFSLKLFGEDIFKGPALPEKYHLFKVFE